MSTLDELKKQASEATLRNQVVTSSKPDEAQQWHKLAPVMKYLQDHFTELANTLNVLDKDTLVDFEISDHLMLKGLKGQNYKITHPGKDKDREFVFEFENSGEHPGYCLLPAGPVAAAFKKTLVDNQISCSTTPVDNNKSIKFEIKPLVRSKYLFTAHLDKENISLSISNYSNIWSQVNYFKKTEITTELMDELTRHVMREPNKYNAMVGNVISDEMRAKLQAKLKAEQKAQKRKSRPQTAKTKPKASKEKTLFGKIFKKK